MSTPWQVKLMPRVPTAPIITVSINGTTVTELLGDTKCLKNGHIALQLHGSMDMHVEFKDIAVLELK